MPTFDELDALIAEARNTVTNAEFSRARGIAESTYSLELIVTKLTDALSALRDTNPDEWEYGVRSASDVEFFLVPREAVAAHVHNINVRCAYRRAAGPWHPVPSSPEGSKQ